MKIAISDQCKEGFHAIKFDKKYRFITYKIDGEQIVLTLPLRFRSIWASEHRHGNI